MLEHGKYKKRKEIKNNEKRSNCNCCVPTKTDKSHESMKNGHRIKQNKERKKRRNIERNRE